MEEIDYDVLVDLANDFQYEFRDLVRKFYSNHMIAHDSEFNANLLGYMQERTSVYAPFVWSDYYEENSDDQSK